MDFEKQEQEAKTGVTADAESEIKESTDVPDSADTGSTVNSKKAKEILTLIKKKPKLAALGALAVLFILIICLSAKPDVITISAEYTGDTAAGVVLSEKNKGIEVTGINEKGKEVKIKKWEIEEPVILEADQLSTAVISYKKLETQIAVKCSTSAAESISAEYSGSLEAGTKITGKNITVKASLKNGEEADVSADCVFEPESLTLEADGSYTVKIRYTDPVSGDTPETSLSFECSTWSTQSIVASYSGYTEEGTVLDENNSGIEVQAVLKDGTKKEITGWKVEKPVELKTDSTGTVKIIYDKFSCELKVECSTMSEKKYKSLCKTISYSELVKNPKGTYGKYIKLTGKVFQVVDDNSYLDFSGETPKTQFCALQTSLIPTAYGPVKSRYLIKADGNIYYVSIPNYNSNRRIVENDTVTVWGTVDLLYTYENLLGASKTVPKIDAEYYS